MKVFPAQWKTFLKNIVFHNSVNRVVLDECLNYIIAYMSNPNALFCECLLYYTVLIAPKIPYLGLFYGLFQHFGKIMLGLLNLFYYRYLSDCCLGGVHLSVNEFGSQQILAGVWQLGWLARCHLHNTPKMQSAKNHKQVGCSLRSKTLSNLVNLLNHSSRNMPAVIKIATHNVKYDYLMCIYFYFNIPYFC